MSVFWEGAFSFPYMWSKAPGWLTGGEVEGKVSMIYLHLTGIDHTQSLGIVKGGFGGIYIPLFAGLRLPKMTELCMKPVQSLGFVQGTLHAKWVVCLSVSGENACNPYTEI